MPQCRWKSVWNNDDRGIAGFLIDWLRIGEKTEIAIQIGDEFGPRRRAHDVTNEGGCTGEIIFDLGAAVLFRSVKRRVIRFKVAEGNRAHPGFGNAIQNVVRGAAQAKHPRRRVGHKLTQRANHRQPAWQISVIEIRAVLSAHQRCWKHPPENGAARSDRVLRPSYWLPSILS